MAGLKNKIKTEYLVLLLVVVLFLLSLSRYCVHGEPRTIVSDDTMQSELFLSDGKEISQPLTITEEMNWRQGEYGLQFLTVSTESDGKVLFQLMQNQEVLEQESVSLQDLAAIQETLGGSSGKGAYIPVLLDFTKLDAGEAALLITTENVLEGELSFASGTDYYGFGETTVDGKGSGMTLFQKYTYHILNGEYWLRLVCFGLVVLGMIGLCLLVAGKEESRKRCYAVFLLLSGMFLAILYIYDSSVMLEPTYAEAVTNFMKYAREESFFKNLLITDAGYLPLFPRLITLFYIKILRLPAADALYFMQMTACILCCMMWAFFCLYPFRKYMSLPLRMVSCMLVMAVCFHQETLFFTNFPYWGILLILLSLFSEMEEWNKAEFWILTILGALFCLSKGAYAVILPFMLLYLCFFYAELTKRQKLYGFCTSGAALLQLLYSFGGSGEGESWIRAEQMGQMEYWLKLLCRSFLDMTGYLFIWIGKHITRFGVAFGMVAAVLTVLMVTGFVCKLLLPKLRKEKIEEKWIVLYSLLLFLAITVVFYRVTTKAVPENWRGVLSASFAQMGNKYEIFCDVAALLFLILGISYTADALKSKGIFLLFLAFCLTSPRMQLSGLGEVKVSDGRIYESHLNTNWEQTKDIINRDAFFIPVRSDWWSYSRNVTVYQVGEENYYEESQGTNLGMMEPGYRSSYTIEEGMPSENLLEVWINRPNRITDTSYKIRLLNEQGNVLQEVTQFGGNGNSKVGFVLDTPVNGVKTIQFLDENEKEVYIDDYICWISAW
ncbi:MAG: hypothetical protein PUD93_00260 [Lachnospiraceae bacterium]|nr:hypothetical protein [Lachnospiraceae bacterium]